MPINKRFSGFAGSKSQVAVMYVAVHHHTAAGVGIEVCDGKAAIGHPSQEVLEGVTEFHGIVFLHSLLKLLLTQAGQV
jgi:hypothetical protein